MIDNSHRIIQTEVYNNCLDVVLCSLSRSYPDVTKLFFPGRGYSIGVCDFVQESVKAFLLRCRTLLKATSLVCTIYSVYIIFYYEYKKRNTCNMYLCAIGIRARYHHIN